MEKEDLSTEYIKRVDKRTLSPPDSCHLYHMRYNELCSSAELRLCDRDTGQHANVFTTISSSSKRTPEAKAKVCHVDFAQPAHVEWVLLRTHGDPYGFS